MQSFQWRRISHALAIRSSNLTLGGMYTAEETDFSFYSPWLYERAFGFPARSYLLLSRPTFIAQWLMMVFQSITELKTDWLWCCHSRNYINHFKARDQEDQEDHWSLITDPNQTRRWDYPPNPQVRWAPTKGRETHNHPDYPSSLTGVASASASQGPT